MQAAGDLAYLRRAMLAGERRTGDEMLAHGQTADDDRLEADFADQVLGQGDGFWIVTRDRHPDAITLALGKLGQLARANGVESADNRRTAQDFGGHHASSALGVD